MRVFVGEPGDEHNETLATGRPAAAAGGVTTIVCMPDTKPAIDDPRWSISSSAARATRAIVNVHPDGGADQGPRRQEMTEIGLLREAGAVAFTDGARASPTPLVMRRA